MTMRKENFKRQIDLLGSLTREDTTIFKLLFESIEKYIQDPKYIKPEKLEADIYKEKSPVEFLQNLVNTWRLLQKKKAKERDLGDFMADESVSALATIQEYLNQLKDLLKEGNENDDTTFGQHAAEKMMIQIIYLVFIDQAINDQEIALSDIKKLANVMKEKEATFEKDLVEMGEKKATFEKDLVEMGEEIAELSNEKIQMTETIARTETEKVEMTQTIENMGVLVEKLEKSFQRAEEENEKYEKEKIKDEKEKANLSMEFQVTQINLEEEILRLKEENSALNKEIATCLETGLALDKGKKELEETLGNSKKLADLKLEFETKNSVQQLEIMEVLASKTAHLRSEINNLKKVQSTFSDEGTNK